MARHQQACRCRPMDPGRGSCDALPRGRGWRAGDAGAAGGPPPVRWLVAGLVELVVVEGGAGAPVGVSGAAAGSAGRGPLGRSVLGDLFVPPAVVELRDGVAQGGADGLGVTAYDPLDGRLAGADRVGDAGRAVAHHL